MSMSESAMNSSKSPEKPKRLMQYLQEKGLLHNFRIINDFEPFNKEDFYIAHYKEYVDSFFSDELDRRYKNILGITWNKEYAETTRYTNASLYNAILSSIDNPDEICFSPTSGFHHAIPQMGAFYCAFSGQVISSVKLYRERKLSGAYIDLDGHYGNSIDNSYDYVSDLHLAIPLEIGNINIESKHSQYITDFKAKIETLKEWIINGKIHYLVFCHGADSCEDDDMGRLLTKEEWLECSNIFYSFIKNLDLIHGIKIPLTLALFGGYNKHDFSKVLDLHTLDLLKCLEYLCENKPS